MPFYYDYGDPNPSTLSQPYQGHWENPADWPRTFTYHPPYGSAYTYYQGIHPPAPVYQSTQPQSNMYYFPGNATSPAGYYLNGAYYGPTAPAAPGWPYTSPSSYPYYPYPTAPTSSYPYPYDYSQYYAAPASMPMPFPASMPMPLPMPSMPMPGPWGAAAATQQAAVALATNAALGAMPNAPSYFVGATAAEIHAQNAIIAANMAAQGLQPPPSQLVPYKPGASQQFWCKELDGTWTLREHNDVVMGELGPGRWERHPTSGYFYYVKHPV